MFLLTRQLPTWPSLKFADVRVPIQLVMLHATIWVREDLVSLTNFFEFLLCRFVLRIQIWVILPRQSAINFLNLVNRSISFYSQKFVVVYKFLHSHLPVVIPCVLFACMERTSGLIGIQIAYLAQTKQACGNT